MSITSNGISEVVKGFSAFEVFTISRVQFSFFTSQVQPEPKFETAFVENSSLKVSKLQKLSFISLAIFQVGVFLEFGVRQFQ
jgi:hypothetical protein